MPKKTAVKEPVKTASKKIGRPKRDFDKQIFEGLCNVCCTVDEIESIFKTDIRTVDLWCEREYSNPFSTVYKELSANGKASVRRNQLNLSKTNASMAIWLGKQWLGQRDLPREVEEFNGTLALLLDRLKVVQTTDDFTAKAALSQKAS